MRDLIWKPEAKLPPSFGGTGCDGGCLGDGGGRAGGVTVGGVGATGEGVLGSHGGGRSLGGWGSSQI